MDAETSAKFINSVVKSIQSVCHGYVDFSDHIKVIGHLYLSVDSNVNLNYIVNEQVCKNDRESSTMFVSNSYHSEPPSKKSVERDRRRLAGPRSKQDIRESETRVAVPSELGHVESDVMLFAAENFPSNSNTDSFQFSSQPHRPQGASKRKRTLSGGAELGSGGASAATDVEIQIAGLIDQDLAGERTGSKARRLSEGDNRVPDNGQDVASFTLSEGGLPGAESGAGDWDVSGGQSTSNRDTMQESLSSRPGPSATITRAPSTDHSKDSNPPSRAPSTPSVKEEPQVDVDLTIVKEEEAPPSQSSCMQSGKGGSSQPLSGASNANYSSGQWDLPSHLQQQQQEMHSRVMRLDPNSSTVEYSSPPGPSTSQAPDPGGLNMLDNAQLYPVMLHPNTATSQDIMSAVSMVEGRSMGQTLPSVMSFSNAGAIPSTSGHRMDMGPKPGGPRPGRLPRSMADQYGGPPRSEGAALFGGEGVGQQLMEANSAVSGDWGSRKGATLSDETRALIVQHVEASGGNQQNNMVPHGVLAKGYPVYEGYRDDSAHSRNLALPNRFSLSAWRARKLSAPVSSETQPRPRPFKCEKCGKLFPAKKNLHQHMALHSDFLKYRCKSCGRRFKWTSSLHSHRCLGWAAGPGLPVPPPPQGWSLDPRQHLQSQGALPGGAATFPGDVPFSRASGFGQASQGVASWLPGLHQSLPSGLPRTSQSLVSQPLQSAWTSSSVSLNTSLAIASTAYETVRSSSFAPGEHCFPGLEKVVAASSGVLGQPSEQAAEEKCSAAATAGQTGGGACAGIPGLEIEKRDVPEAEASTSKTATVEADVGISHALEESAIGD